YRHAPVDNAVSQLHSGLLPARVNFPEMRTVYPPLAEWIFAATYAIGGESVLAFKIPLLLSEFLTLWLLLALLPRLGLRREWIAVYAISPLPVLQFMIDGHLDALAFPFLLAFILLYHQRRNSVAALALGAAAAVKLLPLIHVPLLLRQAWQRRDASWLAAPLLPVLLYLPYLLSGGHPFESLAVYSEKWTFNASVYGVTTWLLGDPLWGRFASMGVFVLALGALAWRKRPLVPAMAAATMLFLLCTPTVHPWYAAWLLVLLPLYPRWSFLMFCASIAVATYPGVLYHLSGSWIDPLWMRLGVYLPPAIIYAFERTGIVPIPAAIPSAS
ncbi:MAG: DUF2029 domain-containing protein, partial [Bacteroidetes bacterium]|nr:DUF2029 domain-containing protein [Bacteroidota bacterium]